MAELKFRKIDKTKIIDVKKYVIDWVNKHPFCTVMIGCDSQAHSKYIKYSVVICLHDIDENGIGHGCHVINADYLDYNKSMKTDLYTKLWQEAELAIYAAQMIDGCGKKISVHLDYNSNEEEYSNVLYNSGIGYVQSFGYDCYGKPFSMVASHTADSYCR